jgi:hypothetical protein
MHLAVVNSFWLSILSFVWCKSLILFESVLTEFVKFTAHGPSFKISFREYLHRIVSHNFCVVRMLLRLSLIISSQSLCILEVVCMFILRLYARRWSVNPLPWRDATDTPSSATNDAARRTSRLRRLPAMSSPWWHRHGLCLTVMKGEKKLYCLFEIAMVVCTLM